MQPCVYGNRTSRWEIANFDPPPPLQNRHPLTDRQNVTGVCVAIATSFAKFGANPYPRRAFRQIDENDFLSIYLFLARPVCLHGGLYVLLVFFFIFIIIIILVVQLLDKQSLNLLDRSP